MISDASKTVNGLVIALAKPNPQAMMQTRNPVNESYPISTHSAVTIGSIESISSNSPRNAPNAINTSAIMHRSSARRF